MLHVPADSSLGASKGDYSTPIADKFMGQSGGASGADNSYDQYGSSGTSTTDYSSGGATGYGSGGATDGGAGQTMSGADGGLRSDDALTGQGESLSSLFPEKHTETIGA